MTRDTSRTNYRVAPCDVSLDWIDNASRLSYDVIASDVVILIIQGSRQRFANWVDKGTRMLSRLSLGQVTRGDRRTESG